LPGDVLNAPAFVTGVGAGSGVLNGYAPTGVSAGDIVGIGATFNLDPSGTASGFFGASRIVTENPLSLESAWRLDAAGTYLRRQESVDGWTVTHVDLALDDGSIPEPGTILLTLSGLLIAICNRLPCRRT
jgi:hypothetical protein